MLIVVKYYFGFWRQPNVSSYTIFKNSIEISTLFEMVSNNAKREIDWLTSNDYSGLRSACVCLKLGINKEKKTIYEQLFTIRLFGKCFSSCYY